MNAPAVRIRDVRRSVTLEGVLDGVDLDIAPGEFVALLGREGSGKGALLRALAGLDHEAQGAGEIALPPSTAMIFPDARLLPWLRVLDNVLLGLDPGEGKRAVLALAEVGLAGREISWPHELSDGEQQRVALARALVRRPALLLADGPFRALDAVTRLQLDALLLCLSERHHYAVLLATDDVDEAIALADRIVMLDHGRLAIDVRVDDRREGEPAARLRAILLRMLGVN